MYWTFCSSSEGKLRYKYVTISTKTAAGQWATRRLHAGLYLDVFSNLDSLFLSSKCGRFFGLSVVYPTTRSTHDTKLPTAISPAFKAVFRH
ncbi:hypothetical protein BIW11_11781 [Tropilaelaps mercedesae]|uniref:Uncharacterized protein n=1 Tax=Tropilaelaps mercedesae TaxID=418985 RepID=A0A1V9X9G8_9ACAR|nr:hypothetical protein BIW11_11781 [Tropilaelaps mercedesae]